MRQLEKDSDGDVVFHKVDLGSDRKGYHFINGIFHRHGRIDDLALMAAVAYFTDFSDPDY